MDEPQSEDSARSERLANLTPAEQRVLRASLAGDPAKIVAYRLGLTEATVRAHLSSIYAKLGVESRAQLVAWWAGSRRGGDAEQEQAGPRIRRRGFALAALLLVVVVGGLLATVIASAPREVPIATIADLARKGEIASLRYSDEKTLFAETSTAGELRSANVPWGEALRLSQEYGIGLANAGYSPLWIGTLVLLLPVITPVAIGLLAAALIFRYRHGRPFSRAG